MSIIQIKNINVNNIEPYDKNPRNNKNAVDKVAQSIKEFGFKVPIILDKDNVIIAGHTRWKAARQLGMTQLPVIYADDLTPEQVKAFRIADNKTAEIADWDEELLVVELAELKELSIDLNSLGFSDQELIELLGQYDNDIVEDDYQLDLPEDPITQQGDIWLLGRHKLMCGDSTKAADVSTLMNGKKANLCITDPPYNVDYEGKTKDALKIQNDNMSNNNFYQFLLDSFKLIYESLEDGASIYVFHADTEGMNFRKAFTTVGLKLAQCCVWVKQSIVLGRQDYHWRHEPILYGWKPTAGHNWFCDRTQSTVWEFDRPTRNEIHPTMKPVKLIAYPMANSSKKHDIIFDPFLGSGSTLIAAEQLNRVCFGMELDPRYCDAIVKRYLEYTEGNGVVTLIRSGNEQRCPVKIYEQ